MTALINDILFPFVLFVAYFIAANLAILEVDLESLSSANEAIVAYPRNLSQIDSLDPTLRKLEWLQTRSLKDLKAIASELNIVPTGNKSYRSTWIEAIISADSDLTNDRSN